MAKFKFKLNVDGVLDDPIIEVNAESYEDAKKKAVGRYPGKKVWGVSLVNSSDDTVLIHFHSNADKVRFSKRMGGLSSGEGLLEEGLAYIKVKRGSKLHIYAKQAAEVFKTSNSSFGNGCDKAEKHINTKLKEIGVENALTAYKVTYDDGSSYVTSMASGVTLDKAKAYFLGKTFTSEGPGGKETKRKVVKVEEA